MIQADVVLINLKSGTFVPLATQAMCDLRNTYNVKASFKSPLASILPGSFQVALHLYSLEIN